MKGYAGVAVQRVPAWVVELGNGRVFNLAICHNSFSHFAEKRAAANTLARLPRGAGHLLILQDLSRDNVNTIHGGSGAAIQNQRYRRGEETGQMVMRAGFGDVDVEDNDERHLIAGQREGG